MKSEHERFIRFTVQRFELMKRMKKGCVAQCEQRILSVRIICRQFRRVSLRR